MKLGVIILNWNDALNTSACLRLVSAWKSIKPEIIVVDNGSHDESAHEIDANFPTIFLVRSEVNRGFAGGNNLGIAKARDLGCDAVLLLNSDAEISENGVATLMKQVKDSNEPIIIGPTIEEHSASGSVLTCGGRDIGRYSRTRIILGSTSRIYARPKSAQTSNRYPINAVADLTEVSYVPGTVILIPIMVFDSIGLLDEDYFFSGEIADFCARAHMLGIKSLIDRSIIAHHGDAGKIKPLRGSLYIYYTLRNRFLYISKHGGTTKLWLKLVWIIKALCMLAISIAKFNMSRARAVALGLADGLRQKWGNRNEQFSV